MTISSQVVVKSIGKIMQVYEQERVYIQLNCHWATFCVVG